MRADLRGAVPLAGTDPPVTHPNDMTCVIGIDGGATSTRGLLADPKGQILASAQRAGANYHHAGLEGASEILSGLCEDLLARANQTSADLKAVCLGLAGAGRLRDRERILSKLSVTFSSDILLLVTDADIALTGGCLSDTGVLVIAGTGSIVYGRNEKGESARVGGYGPLLSDEGSGYAFGKAGLRAVMRAYDGTGIQTNLRKRIFKKLDLRDEDDMVTWVMQFAQQKADIATLAGVVLDSFAENDPAAVEIVHEGADELSLGVERVAARLGLTGRFPVVFSGGLLEHWDCYYDLLKRKIRSLLPGVEVMTPKMKPTHGAVLHALAHGGIAVNEDVLANLQVSLRDAQAETG